MPYHRSADIETQTRIFRRRNVYSRLVPYDGVRVDGNVLPVRVHKPQTDKMGDTHRRRSVAGGEILMKPIFELIERYHFYFDNIENYRTSPDDSFFMFFVFCSILIATQVFGYFEKKKTPCERLSLMCLCLCVIEVSLARFFVLTARAVTYFSVYLTITLPSWLEKCFDDKWRYYIRVALTLALLIITITMSFYGNKHICPFVFFWQ